MLDGRSHHGLIFYLGYTYALGGNDANGNPQATFERLKLGKTKWEPLPDLERPIVHCSVAESANGLFFTDFGSNVVYTFNTASRSFGRLNFEVPANVNKSLAGL
jgi:hypothetical protein